MTPFRRFAWLVVGYHVAIVLWGAFVRATGSGAGCGSHWPLCNGDVVPRAPAIQTIIEYTHRVTSGVALVLVGALVAWAFARFPKDHAVRKAAVTSAVLLLVEAALGAGLVLFGWVAGDTSVGRGWVVAIHLCNTFLLLGALAVTAEVAGRPRGLELYGRGSLAAAFGLCLATLLVSGATGAVAALGDTLYPSISFAEGLRQELEAGAPLLLRLRMVHPFAAVAGSIVVGVCARAALRARPTPRVRSLASALLGLVTLQLLTGAANVALLAPLALQLVHLALADAVWLVTVVLAAEVLAPGAVPMQHTPVPAAAQG
ncbi:MAG: COX15/CtaA family protein [Anaeromyxobacter sp.]